MRKYILLLIVCVFSYTADAVSVPSSVADPSPAIVGLEKMDPSRMKARDIEQLLGRRLTLKEKIGWMLVKRQLKKNRPADTGFDVAKKARTAKTFGTIALVALFTPFAFISLPFAITAIIMGSKVRRIDPGNRDAKKAITRGIITLAIFVAMIIIIAAIISAFVIVA